MVRENLKIYKSKKVFVTGHTGFKGSWLIATLQSLGCEVYGFALNPVSVPNHFDLLHLEMNSTIADIRDFNCLKKSIHESKAEIVFHLAAQAFVRASYIDPRYTYDVNVMGSLNVLEASRSCEHVRAVVMITTDKVYENLEKNYAYKETDQLGGYDLYSSSKACCELMINSYRNSFLNLENYGKQHQQLIASVRAGNVIGGGDWSMDRLIPDAMKATAIKEKVLIRNPHSIRPWQHVMDCIGAYLILGKHLLQGKKEFSSGWNVSPDTNEIYSVQEVLQECKLEWEDLEIEVEENKDRHHEASVLMLDNSATKQKLGWFPKYNTLEAIHNTVHWYRTFYNSNEIISIDQVENYLKN